MTFTELLTPTKSEPHGCITFVPATDNALSPVAGTLTITGTRCHCSYRVEEFPTGHAGRGYMLFKLNAGSDKTEERYAVLTTAHGLGVLCECRGFAAHGKCKHLSAVETLIRNGQL